MTVWADVTIDFIEGLSKIHGKSVILIVVDWFSKYTDFLPLGNAYMTTTITHFFFDTVVKLHGIPSSIVSDRDPSFMGHFWWELFKMAGVKLRFSSVFHPQLDV
jgi:hypothetical protein